MGTELQAKYQKLAQEYAKVRGTPTVKGGGRTLLAIGLG